MPSFSRHRFLARAILAALGARNPTLPDDQSLVEHVRKLHQILDEAYRVHVGHLRPGERKDAPKLEDALAAAAKREEAYLSTAAVPENRGEK